MERQAAEREERNGKGVRKPRSDAARRPRPHSGLVSSAPALDGLHGSHPSYDSYRERSEHLNSAQERKGGEKFADVMEVGGVRADPGLDRKDSRKDDKYYSRHSSKEQHASSGRHIGRGDRSGKYEGEGRVGRDEYRPVRDVGRSRDYESRSARDERGPRYGGSGFQDSARDSSHRGSERREEARQGRGDDRRTVEEVGKIGSRRDEQRDNKIFSRKEKFSDKRFHGKEDSKQERGDWRESNGIRRPEHERGKRLEKSMKDIVDADRPVLDDIDEYLGEGRRNDRNRLGRFRERDEFDNGKERLPRDSSHTHRVRVADKPGSRELNLKLTEKDVPEHKSGGFTKLKLKVGGVTHTIVSDSAKKVGGAVASSASKTRESENAGAIKRRRHRLILQDQSDDDEGFDFPPPKVAKKADSFSPGYAAKGEQKTPNGVKVNSISKSEHPKTMTLGTRSSLPAVRKSSRVPKRRVLDGDEDDVEPRRPSASSKGGKIADDEENEDGDADAEFSEDAGQTVGEESFEGLGDEDDDDGPQSAKPAKVLPNRPMKEISGSVVALTARQRAMQTSKDVDRESAPSLIEYPEGLTSTLSRKGKNNLSEAERQVKRVEAAHRRKQQVEKTARDIQASAIQRILGQDSTRKRRESRLEKQRQDIEEEKKAAELAPSTNSIRWNLGPTGSVVSFSEDVGLPSFFSAGPSRYPPPREKCAAPACSNSFKYRDGKSNVPLCSLQCYKLVHTALPVTSTH